MQRHSKLSKIRGKCCTLVFYNVWRTHGKRMKPPQTTTRLHLRSRFTLKMGKKESCVKNSLPDMDLFYVVWKVCILPFFLLKIVTLFYNLLFCLKWKNKMYFVKCICLVSIILKWLRFDCKYSLGSVKLWKYLWNKKANQNRHTEEKHKKTRQLISRRSLWLNFWTVKGLVLYMRLSSF